jgi:hypothetical protein
MRINPTSEFAADNTDPHTGEVEGCYRQDEKQAFQSGGSVQSAGFNLKAIRFVVQKVFFDGQNAGHIRQR